MKVKMTKMFLITVWRKPGGRDGNTGKNKNKKQTQSSSNWRTSNINEAAPWEVVARVRHGSQGGF